MTALLGKVLMGLLAKLLTEKFFAKLLAIGLWNASQMTSNKVDDKMAESVAEALGVAPEIYK